MKRNLRNIALTLVLGSIAPCTLADGFYVAADAGAMSYSNTSILSAFGVDFNPGPSIAVAGGYIFNRYFGVEAGYTNTGDSTINTSGFINSKETLKSSATQLAVVGMLPISDHFSLIGKVGMTHNKIDYSFSSAGINASASGSKTNTLFGIGGQYNFNQHWGLRFQYVDLGKTQVGPVIANGVPQTGTTGDVGMSNFSVGGVYNF